MAVVAFVVHPDRPEAAAAAAEAEQWLAARGHTTVRVPDTNETELVGDGTEVELAVSLGGDGTMLRTVALASAKGVPVLGVNLGRLGYLTEVEPAGLTDALDRFLAGDYEVEERMTLEVSIERAHQDAELLVALNEAVVEKTVPGHTVRVSAGIAGRPFVTYMADGVLVSTPTGTTAYNLSLRGPILSPRLRALVVTPISPHMLFDRSLVLEPSEWLRLEVLQPRPAVVVVDGQKVGLLEPGEAMCCREGPVAARLVTFGERDFHAILKARFGLTDR
ncbi:MAG: NAD(+)/NADH kinase [Acidimicrobiales bacterium]